MNGSLRVKIYYFYHSFIIKFLCKNLSAKYYQDNKGCKKKIVKDIKLFLKRKRSDNFNHMLKMENLENNDIPRLSAK